MIDIIILSIVYLLSVVVARKTLLIICDGDVETSDIIFLFFALCPVVNTIVSLLLIYYLMIHPKYISGLLRWFVGK